MKLGIGAKMIIAFMGNDGSGKTTIAKEIDTYFRNYGFETYYKHEYDYVLLRYLFKLIGRKRLEKSRKGLFTCQKSWKYQIWPVLVWCDVWLQYIYFKMFKRKTIILLDRYIYDHYMSFDYSGHLNRYTRWLYIHFPKPDIAVLLWAEASVAYERKKETHSYDISFYGNQLKKYLKLADNLKITNLNTNENIKKTKSRILNLFFSNKAFLNLFIKRCHENRILFFVIKKDKLYELNPVLKKILANYVSKKRKYIKELNRVEKELDKVNWVLIDYRPYEWIPVHDIDILIQSNYDTSIRFKKSDIFKLDIQSSILGTSNERFLLNYLWKHKRKIKYHGLKIKVLEQNFIVILLKVLKNGFVTLDQYMLLRGHSSSKQHGIPFNLIKPLNGVFDHITNLNSKKQSFPYFLPFTLVLKSLKDMSVNKLLLTRILFFSILTRMTYLLKGNIPYHKGELIETH